MQRNPHSYQIATGYRTFYSLSLIYQPITKKTIVFDEKMWMNMNFVWMWLRKCLMVLKTGHLVKNNDCLPYYSMEKT